MATGAEYLTLPGPGGYTMTWSPGTVRYKLEKAPIGHLILPCDEFAKVGKEQAGLEEPKLTFYGTRYIKSTSEVGTQTDEVPDDLPRKFAAVFDDHVTRNKWTYVRHKA